MLPQVRSILQRHDAPDLWQLFSLSVHPVIRNRSLPLPGFHECVPHRASGPIMSKPGDAHAGSKGELQRNVRLHLVQKGRHKAQHRDRCEVMSKTKQPLKVVRRTSIAAKTHNDTHVCYMALIRRNVVTTCPTLAGSADPVSGIRAVVVRKHL